MHKGEVLIARWISCFNDAYLEQRFREALLSEQRSRAIVFAWIVATVPSLQLIGEAQQVLAGSRSVFIEFLPRLVCVLCSLLVILYTKRANSYQSLDRVLNAYGLGLIGFSMYLAAVRPDLSPSMMVAGLTGMVALIYFFSPLTTLQVSILGVGASFGYGLTCIFLREEVRQEWLRLLLWLIALNALGYFGVRSLNANLRRIFWQNEELNRRKSELEVAYELERATFRRFLQFSELITHEFRNALAVVKSKAQLIQLSTELDAPFDTDAAVAIERAVNRIDDLFSQWLSSDTLVESNFVPRLRRVSIKELFDRLALEAPISPAHPLDFHPAPDLFIEGDPDLLIVAILNIIGNAIKYSPDGGHIIIRTIKTEERIEIAISDQGIGINPSESEYIFDKYYRSKYDNGVSGFGLGLFFVRRIVTLHGGIIWAEPNIGAGSIFTISLPYLGQVNDGNVVICR